MKYCERYAAHGFCPNNACSKSHDLDVILENVDEYNLNDALQRCEGDQECAFHELVSEGDFDLPRFYLDDRYTPSVNKEDFNAYLVDALDSYLN